MASNPLISVVVPLYNHARFIRACLESIFQQSYSHLELIVIDDGSSDLSPDIAKEQLGRCPYPCRFVRQENRGAPYTINKGLNISQGQYLTILNSDDRYHIQRLFKLIQAAEDNNSRLVFSKIRHIDEDGNPILNETLHPYYYRRSLARSTFFPTRTFEFLRQNWAVTSGNLFFHRGLFEEVGPFSDFEVCHDWDFILRAIVVEEPVFVEEVLLDYRVHGGNTIKRRKEKQDQEIDEVLSSYLAKVKEAKNPLAPGPRDWGPYWGVFVDTYMRHIKKYPQAWELLQKSKRECAREFSRFETLVIETLQAQASYSFQQSEDLQRFYEQCCGEESKPGFRLFAQRLKRFLKLRIKEIF